MRIDVEEVGGLDQALKILQKGLVVLDPESIFSGAKIRERDLPPLTSGKKRNRPFFMSRSERRRKKKFMAAKKARRREWKARRFSRSDPKEYWALKEYENIVSAEQEADDLRLAIHGEEKEEETVGTVLVMIRRRRQGQERILTLQDKMKGGRIGFITGGIRPEETLRDAACRETSEEAGLTVKEKGVIPFHEKNVSRSLRPYLMTGVVVKKFSGRLRAGEEIEPGSLRWRTFAEIDELIIQDQFVLNHTDFFNEFCSQEGAANV